MSQAKTDQCVVARGIGLPAVPSAERILVPTAQAFHVQYLETARLETLLNGSPSHILGIVHQDQNPGGAARLGPCPFVHLNLPQFTGPPMAEVWTSTPPVTYHRNGKVHCAMNDDVLFGTVHMEESPGVMLDTVTCQAYGQLLAQARALGCPHLLRVWNYFSDINGESNGLERYQRFCAGRYQALAEGLPDFPRSLPAGTAIGTMSGPLTIYFLAARRPGTHIENPRQVSAYQYPPVYGPRSPSFARATLRPSTSGSHLLIAGTASVVGHVSEHIGEPHAQTLEILRNLNALITEAELLHGVAREQWFGQALFKVYIRHPEHFSTVRDILKEQLPSHAQVLYVQGEMCRSELLVEVEGILDQEQTFDVSQKVSPTRMHL